MLSRVQCLFHLLVQVKHTQAEIVPKLRVAAHGVRCFFKVLERLEILLLLEESEAKVVKDLGSPL